MEGLDLLQDGCGVLATYNRGMQLGQIDPAFLAFAMYNGFAFPAGLSLGQILKELRSFCGTLEEYAFVTLLLPAKIWGQSVSDLSSECIHPGSFAGECVDDTKLDISTLGNMSVFTLYVQKMVVLAY